jgi:hypothetical protein
VSSDGSPNTGVRLDRLSTAMELARRLRDVRDILENARHLQSHPERGDFVVVRREVSREIRCGDRRARICTELALRVLRDEESRLVGELRSIGVVVS